MTRQILGGRNGRTVAAYCSVLEWNVSGVFCFRDCLDVLFVLSHSGVSHCTSTLIGKPRQKGTVCEFAVDVNMTFWGRLYTAQTCSSASIGSVLMHDSFWEHCVCCCCNNAFICLSFSPLIWTPQVSGSDRSCAQIEFFFPYPFRFIIRSLWPTSKLNFWPLRQKAQIKQLVWDCGVSSWLGRTDREREALKAAQTGVMTVTGGQIQLCRDELLSHWQQRHSASGKSSEEGKHTAKSSKSPDSLPMCLACISLITATSSSDYFKLFPSNGPRRLFCHFDSLWGCQATALQC